MHSDLKVYFYYQKVKFGIKNSHSFKFMVIIRFIYLSQNAKCGYKPSKWNYMITKHVIAPVKSIRVLPFTLIAVKARPI